MTPVQFFQFILDNMLTFYDTFQKRYSSKEQLYDDSEFIIYLN